MIGSGKGEFVKFERQANVLSPRLICGWITASCLSAGI